MDKKIRIGVLFGGRSGEHEVSLMSARSVLSVLDDQKYEVVPIGITRQGVWVTGKNALEDLQTGKWEHLTQVALLPDLRDNTLYRVHQSPHGRTIHPLTDIDIMFPLLHGTYGEDGTLQGFFEMAGIAYVGAGVLASSLGMDKASFKMTMRAYQIPVVNNLLLTASQIDAQGEAVIASIESQLSYPVFVKPSNLGSSVGISKCKNSHDLQKALIEARKYDRRVVVEQGIAAREIEVAVLGNENPQASIPGEIRPLDEFYTYRAKYQPGGSELLIPAPMSETEAERFQELAVRVFQAVDCAGMARVDFLWDKASGQIYVSELNTIPGFTQTSMYPKLWQASGIAYGELIDRLIQLGLERKAENDRKTVDFSPPA
ncbi:MAG: D-alanine--D-alanine ligase [Anaerolineae bacterium]|nr:D-alanine--D-alanine ligase [Anaerolineae bacterium]